MRRGARDIHRCDECARFASDDEAAEHVVRLALEAEGAPGNWLVTAGTDPPAVPTEGSPILL